MRTTLLYLLAMPLCTSAWAQPLMVYSELAKLDAKAQAVSPATPREVLSPPVVRNGFTSLQLAIDVAPNKQWELWIAQNPENAVDVTLYRVSGERLDKVSQPAAGTGPAVFWMDMWAKRSAPVERIKIEPQLHVDNDWVIYPMEGRMTDAVVPDAPASGWPAGMNAPADVMRAFACGAAPVTSNPSKELSLASLRYRNVQQDVALAGKMPKVSIQTEFQNRVGSCTATTAGENPERYLRMRDFLFAAK